MSDYVVITRPEPDASDYAQELQSSGYQVLVEPMLSLYAVEFQQPDVSEYDVIVATSANAFDFYVAGGGEVSSIPVLCVGKHTAEHAYKAGFEDVSSVDGTGEDLYHYIVEKSDFQKTLHICGKHVAFPVVEHLKVSGFDANALCVYQSIPANNFSDHFLQALSHQNVSAVTFFSKRTAETFVRLAQECDSEIDLSGIKALSISDAVLKCVRVLNWKELHASGSPDRQGMQRLLEANIRL